MKTMPAGQFKDRCLKTLGCRRFLTRTRGSGGLPQPFPGDPADQLIVATARDRDATLVTKDDRIRRYAHVRSAW
jgi:PIN domain nuclease of toxin-antitoxin system